MQSQTIKVGDYENDWQIVEFVGARSPAHKDHEMASQTADKAAMKTPMVQASDKHEMASLR